MYINNIHVLYYFFIGLLGIAVGQFLDFANVRLEEHKKVICKEFFTGYLKNMEINWKTIYIIPLIYVALLYFNGFTLKFLEYIILTPMLISAFIIDYRKQIIPNRLVLTIFEVAILFAVIFGLTSLNLLIDKIFGMLAGAGIFLVITLIGGLIAGKEAMGFGDVKLMGALGLIFGLIPIVEISIIAFLLAAIISLTLLATKKKKSDEYIPFGPFIVMATFIVMFVPSNLLIYILLKIFSLGIFKE